jgi:hypothetical protein
VRTTTTLVGCVTAVLWIFPGGNALATGPQPITVPASGTLSGTNGVGSIVNPGLSCANGGEGNYRDFLIDTPITGYISSSLPGHLRANLDVQHDGVEPPTGPAQAFLLGSQSHATISNQRGTVELQLAAGDCKSPTLPFDGTTVGPGTGTWTVLPASAGNTGSYAGAQGSGTFALQAALGPGAANPWSLSLSGTLAVQEPSLRVQVVNTYWGNLGLDYATRVVSVTYQVTNTGPGDAYGVTLTNATAAPGASFVGTPTNASLPLLLGDLAAGTSTQVTLKYGVGTPVCSLVILGCTFPTKLTFSLPDALDVAATATGGGTVTAPDFPPPASEGL